MTALRITPPHLPRPRHFPGPDLLSLLDLNLGLFPRLDEMNGGFDLPRICRDIGDRP